VVVYTTSMTPGTRLEKVKVLKPVSIKEKEPEVEGIPF
jgi:hypothetical protein